MVNKRENETGEFYEFLVKFDNMPRTCNAWIPANKVPERLILAFESHLNSAISEKQHIAAWYPFREDFVVQWKNFPYFVVSYGAGQFNKFCIVGLSKDGKQLKCKNSKNCNVPRHQAHVKLVERLMKEKELIIHQKSIIKASELTPIEPSIPTISTFPKPLSSSKISFFLSSEIKATLAHQLEFPKSIPMEFKPSSPPSHCKCILADKSNGTYKSEPEIIPGKANGSCSVWLLYGPPLTERTMYYWRCKHNNPICDIFYDGQEHGFLVYSTTTIVSYSIPMDFALQLITGKGASFSGFAAHKNLMNTMCFGYPAESHMKKSLFIKVLLCKYLNIMICVLIFGNIWILHYSEI